MLVTGKGKINGASIDSSRIEGKVSDSPIAAQISLDIPNLMTSNLIVENNFEKLTMTYQDLAKKLQVMANLNDFSNFSFATDLLLDKKYSAKVFVAQPQMRASLVFADEDVFKLTSVFPVSYQLMLTQPIEITSSLDLEKMVTSTDLRSPIFDFSMHADLSSANMKINSEKFNMDLLSKYSGNMDQFKSTTDMNVRF